MKLKVVNDTASRKAFLKLPYKIYKDEPAWIAPLEKDIENIFDPTHNPAFADGECIRWILTDDKDKVIGRVAAFYNKRNLQSQNDYPAGGMGFFECINDEQAAFALFDACREWLVTKEMLAMDGPVNFGERDKFWGLLVKGFDEPSYQEPYNTAYYEAFFEKYGFREYFQQHTYRMRKETFAIDRLEKITQRVIRNTSYTFSHFESAKLDKYVHDFATIYNAAWSKFENFKPVTDKEIKAIFKELKPILVEEFIWYAYVGGEPAGFIVMMPDVNQIFKYVNGKLDIFGKLKFLYYKATKPMTKIKGLVFGIAPQYQNLGLDAALVYHFHKEAAQKAQYTIAEISWVGGFNPKMQSLMKGMNGEVSKVHITYRKLFDENLPFKPYELGEYK
jgi:hypothetical protein